MLDNYSGLTERELSCLQKCRQMEAECRSLWIRAMEYSPRLASYCPHWHDFTVIEWVEILSNQKDLINIAPQHLFNELDWLQILRHQPALIEYCPMIDDFSEEYFEELQNLYPWLERKTVRAKCDKCDKSGSK